MSKKSSKNNKNYRLVDWDRIRNEYISKPCSYRYLAEKYGVSLSLVSARGKSEGWVQLKKNADDSILRKAQKELEDRYIDKAVERIVQDIDYAGESVDAVLQLTHQALQDQKQFYKHAYMKQTSTQSKEGSTFSMDLIEKEMSILDTKRLDELTRTLERATKLYRELQGIVSAEKERQLDIQERKLEHDIQRSNTNDGDDTETGIVLMPDAIPENEEWVEEGGEDEEE